MKYSPRENSRVVQVGTTEINKDIPQAKKVKRSRDGQYLKTADFDKPPKKKKKKKAWAIVLIVLCALLVTFVAAGWGILEGITSGMKKVRISDEELSISESAARAPSHIKNIVFLGIDEQENRSDVMMVVSVNMKTNVIRVISLLRDSKVNIEGCPWGTKLGYAYKWGGAPLAVKTVNQNFNTAFRDYIAMDFDDVAGAVDKLGGVEVELTANEAAQVNEGAAGLGYDGADAHEGLCRLNGAQAVTYSRIRSAEENDSEARRASRQQIVIEAMIESAKKLSKTEYIGVAGEIFNNIETTLNFIDLIELLTLNINQVRLERYTIPDENYETDVWGGWETVEGWYQTDTCAIDETQWVWIYDLNNAAQRLHYLTEGGEV